MKTIKVSELSGASLDWAVAKSEGRIWAYAENFLAYYEDEGEMRYATDWAQGGPIIEREKISVGYQPSAPEGSQCYATNRQGSFGISDAPLIAAMRCYVAVKLGDEVEVPEELL